MSEAFEVFELDPRLLRAVDDLDFEIPTPIQHQAIPALMGGRDVLGQAQTGTGKTAAFALPILHRLDPQGGGVQALVVEPTRELAMQVARAFREYGRHQRVDVLAVYGGQAYDRQIRRLERGVDVVVGTPGRMLDLIRKGVLDLSQVRTVVLDEADEMLSMGFIEDMEAILKETPETRQTALFSATLPKPIRSLAERYMKTPETISVDPEQITVATTAQHYVLVNESDKLAALTRLLEVEEATRVLIFSRTKVGAAKLAEDLFARGIQVEALHGDLPQASRERVMGHFREGQTTILVATDVAARGLDIENISHVINFDVPLDPEAYVHRIGRTGRAGKAGIAITLLTPRELRRLREIEAFTSQPIERVEVPSEARVRSHRDARFLQQMLLVLTETADGDEQHDLVAQLRDLGFPAETIAAAAMRLARAEELAMPIEPVGPVREPGLGRTARGGRKPPYEQGGARRRRSKGGREDGMVRLAMDLGETQGVRPRDVVGSIAGEADIPGKGIGAIDIQKERTLVEVASRYAEQVLTRMRRFRLRGHWATLYRVD
jgi:ATP-dependent RNA helicase DeaD